MVANCGQLQISRAMSEFYLQRRILNAIRWKPFLTGFSCTGFLWFVFLVACNATLKPAVCGLVGYILSCFGDHWPNHLSKCTCDPCQPACDRSSLVSDLVAKLGRPENQFFSEAFCYRAAVNWWRQCERQWRHFGDFWVKHENIKECVYAPLKTWLHKNFCDIFGAQ